MNKYTRSFITKNILLLTMMFCDIVFILYFKYYLNNDFILEIDIDTIEYIGVSALFYFIYFFVFRNKNKKTLWHIIFFILMLSKIYIGLFIYYI